MSMSNVETCFFFVQLEKNQFHFQKILLYLKIQSPHVLKWHSSHKELRDKVQNAWKAKAGVVSVSYP